MRAAQWILNPSSETDREGEETKGEDLGQGTKGLEGKRELESGKERQKQADKDGRLGGRKKEKGITQR